MPKLLQKTGTHQYSGDVGQTTLEIKAVDGETGEFEGYASVFGVKDRGWDIVEPGAFLASIASRPAKGVKMLWHHDPRDLRGSWSDIQEDAYGLKVVGKVNLNLSKGPDTYEMLKADMLDGMSIGYTTEKHVIDDEVQARRLIKVNLYEISLVTFPMNEDSLINRVKSGHIPTVRELESILARDAGLSVQQSKAFIADGYKALTSARDAAGSEDLKEFADQMDAMTAYLTRSK